MRSWLRFFASFAFVAGLGIGIGGGVYAQTCTTIDPPCPPDYPPGVSIVPSSGSFSSSSATITVYVSDDYDLNTATFNLKRNGTTLSFSMSYTSASIGSGTNAITLVSGTNTVIATICDEPGGQCTSDTASYTYTPPPPPPAKAVPQVSLAPHSGDYWDPSRCVAGCFEKTLAYSTVPYVTLDAPRSVTLVYSAAQAVPKGRVMVDVFDNSTSPPDRMSLQLRRPDGTYVTFTNGSSQVFFAAGNGTYRLGAQFDASGLATGAYDYTAVVRSYWSDGTFQEAPGQALRVLVVNDSASPYGWGWGIAGLQRLTIQSNGILVTDGSGSASFFLCTTGCASYTKPAGDFSSLVKVSSTYERTWPDGTKAIFNSAGRMTSVRDRFSNTTSFAYNGSGALTTITDPVGQVTTLAYDASGKLDYVRDPASRTTQVTVNATSLDLRYIYDPDGVRAVDAVYSGHVLSYVTDRLGGRTDYAQDAAAKLSQVQLPTVTAGGQSVRPTTTLRSAESVVFVDGSGLGGSSNPAPARIAAAVRAKITAPNGDSTVYAVSRWGSPTLMGFRDPNTGTWQEALWEYNGSGQLTREETPTGGSVSYTWSGSKLTFVTPQSSGATIQYGYASSNDLVDRVWVGGTLVQRNYYNSGASWRMDSTRIEATGALTKYTYDSRGRVLTVRDPQNHLTTIVYYTSGTQNTNKVTAPRGNGANGTTTWVYDAYGRPTSVTDPASRTVTTAYDLNNRVTSSTAPLSTTVQYGYDDVNRTYTVTDPKSQVYTTVTNVLGWVETATDPRGKVERYTYDQRGNVLTYTNRRNQVATFTYDDRDRPLTIAAGGQTTTFSYDPDNRWMTAQNAESVDTVRTDADGRLVEHVTRLGGKRYVLRPTYTPQGQRNKLEIDYPTSPITTRTIQYGWDADEFLNYSVTDYNPNSWTALRYNYERLDSATVWPTGTSPSTKLQRTLSYTAAHNLAAASFNQGRDPTLGRRYSYDNLDRMTTRRRGTEPATNVLGDVYKRTVTYDGLGRLATYKDEREEQDYGEYVCPDPFDLLSCYWEIINTTTLLRQDTYTYDAAGNRTDNGAVIATGNRVTSFDGFTLTWDDDGNLLSKAKSGWSQTFTWNALGQLTQVVTNGVTTTYGYDAFGRRVRKTVGGTVTRYLWDGDDLLAELTSSGGFIREYVSYPGIDRPHSVRRASDGAVFYYVTERPGSVVHLVNTLNTVVNTYEYGPWGEPITTSEQVVQPLRFAGREWDGESALYYVRARYYDPALGRFVSEDPIGLAGGINPFVYGGDDPVNGRDPLGLDDEDCPFGFEDTGFRVVIGGVEYTVCHNPRTGKSALGGSFDLDPITITADHPGRGDSDYSQAFLDRVLWGDKCVDEGQVVSGSYWDGVCLPRVDAVIPEFGPGAGVAKGIARTIRGAQGANVTFTRVGTFARAVWEVRGQTGASYVRWYRAFNTEGRTVSLFKDVFNQAGNWIRRDRYWPL